MERELALELVRVTEAAALSSSRWLGLGRKNEADDAATTAMRHMFETIDIRGTVVIGEGEMDEAPMLYIGEQIGNGQGAEVDIAVDPLEGTNNLTKGLGNSLSVLAVSEKGRMLHAPDMYMAKLAVGPKLAGKVSLDAPISETLQIAAAALSKGMSELTVMILDRERHAELIQQLRDHGVRTMLLPDGDVAGAIAPSMPESGVDLYIGSGGAPEGVLAAAALRCLGGELQGRLLVTEPHEYERCLEMGIADPGKLLTMEDMVGGDDVIFAATGITESSFLKGVRHLEAKRAMTHSLVMRSKTRTIRYIQATHDLEYKSI